MIIKFIYKKRKLFITYHCDMIFENGVLNKFINFFSYLFMDLAFKNLNI